MKKKMKSSDWASLIIVLIVILDMDWGNLGFLDYILLGLSMVWVTLLGYGFLKGSE